MIHDYSVPSPYMGGIPAVGEINKSNISVSHNGQFYMSSVLLFTKLFLEKKSIDHFFIVL